MGKRYRGIRQWRAKDLGNIFMRSSWERNFGRILELWKQRSKILHWFYEVEYFPFPVKRGTKDYLPDFKVLELKGKHYYVEIKGQMDPRSATQLKRFRKYYPHEHLEVVDRAAYKALKKEYRSQIPQWEKDSV